MKVTKHQIAIFLSLISVFAWSCPSFAGEIVLRVPSRSLVYINGARSSQLGPYRYFSFPDNFRGTGTYSVRVESEDGRYSVETKISVSPFQRKAINFVTESRTIGSKVSSPPNGLVQPLQNDPNINHSDDPPYTWYGPDSSGCYYRYTACPFESCSSEGIHGDRVPYGGPVKIWWCSVLTRENLCKMSPGMTGCDL
jgi:hypothetical protein